MIRQTRWVAALLLLTAFAVGGLAGMALEEGLGLDWFDFLDEDENTPAQLLEGIDLSAEQRIAADGILERQEDRLELYWEDRVPEIQVILQESYAEIREILTPEQAAVFERRIDELRGRVPEEFGD